MVSIGNRVGSVGKVLPLVCREVVHFVAGKPSSYRTRGRTKHREVRPNLDQTVTGPWVKPISKSHEIRVVQPNFDW